ncbi:MAG: hydroxyphenylacetyl-CoA thioesterase PaaI [Gammaproteobacteria bacterium]|nr:hydroxyphenylacetyl-CoA thioesterase PaaI [Gammaproteobacteria bacterium]
MSQLETAKQCAKTMWAGDKASKALGIKVAIREAGSATAHMRVREDMVNGFNVCHGGLIFTLADTAFAFACNAYDRVTFAASASIEFVRPAQLGDKLSAVAREEHRGSRSGYYAVTVENDLGEVVALFRGRAVSRDQPVIAAENDT